MEYRAVGSHDMTDWVLYQYGSEIASSRSDRSNLTRCPSSFMSQLKEGSNTYTLKCRYHDATNDLWSEWGEITFTTKYRYFDPSSENYPNISPNVTTPGIHLKVCRLLRDYNCFESSSVSPSSDFIVVINGRETDQSLFRITANAGDTLLVKPKGPYVRFPLLNTRGDWFSEVLSPLPTLWQSSSQQVTSFAKFFMNCKSLRSLPNDLFDNCKQVTSFSLCFWDCQSLQSLPYGLFYNFNRVTDFSGCFHGCTSLGIIPYNIFDGCDQATNFDHCFMECGIVAIPSDLFQSCRQATIFRECFKSCKKLESVSDYLFDYASKANNFKGCFNNCSLLNYCNVRIVSKDVSDASYFLYGAKSRGTVRVPKGSKTASTFRYASSTNCNVVEY